MKRTAFSLLLLFIFSYSLPAQNETGYPQIQNYSPRDYGGDVQNWAIEQDTNGIIYVGNNLGLLEYDGTSWKLNKIPSGSVIRSICIADDGKIYVGSVGDLGFFFPDSFGELKFHSLLSYLKPENRDFSDVWNVYAIGDEIVFSAFNYIFKWSDDKKSFKVIKATNTFHIAFKVNNDLYVREWDTGILKMEGDTLKLVPGGERFASERIYVMIPFPGEENVILLVTRNEGLFKYDGKNFIPFGTEADEFLKKNLIYSPGAVLKDDNIVLLTMLGGSVVIDKKGKIIHRLNKAAGLPSNTQYGMNVDKSGGIWLATDYGLSRVDYSSHVTYFDSRNGLSNSISAIHRYKGVLYIATGAGVYYLESKTSQFHFIPELGNQSFYFLEAKGTMLVGNLDGIFQVEKDKVVPVRRTIRNDYSVQYIHLSASDTNRLYVSTGEGMGVLLNKNGKWTDAGKIINIPDFTSSIVEEEDGTLWTGTGTFGVYSIRYPEVKGVKDFNNPQITRYGEDKGIPLGQVFPRMLDGKIYFFTPNDIFRYDKDKDYFYLDSTFTILSSSGIVLNELTVKDKQNRLWLSRGRQPVLGTLQVDGTYKWETSPFKRFSDEILGCIYPDDSSTVWFGTGFGVIKFEFNKKQLYDKSFKVLIRQASYGKGSTVYYSGFDSNKNPPQVAFNNNSARFVFAATYFEQEDRNQYRTFLEGFDESWSAWTREHIKEYTNLPPGNYKFKVISRNLEDLLSNEASFSFTIMPPWYRTWWAYVIYLILFAGIVFGFVRILSRRLTQKERQRAYLRETELRAEAAETENERRKNVEMLSEIGRDITANLSVESIIDTVYNNVNTLMDASVFGIGLYDEHKHKIVFPATIEKGVKLDTFYININDENRPAVWCYKNQKEIMINDYQQEYSKYIKEIKTALKGDNPESMLYLPLNYKNKNIGVITAQSFTKNAYTDYHLNILRNLAAYTSIALDNADAYTKLNDTIVKLNTALNDLKSTQEKLIVQQKLASLGQLTAGIAHEIKNPLNFVNNFSQLGKELIDELKEELEKLTDIKGKEALSNIEDLLSGIELNIMKINEHGSRANRIVNSMLQHSRGKVGERKISDINAILEEDLNLAYHGFRARDTSFNITIEKEFDPALEEISIVPQDVSRVFLNIINNGFYETHSKKKETNNSYDPILKVMTRNAGDCIEIRIRDNGNGIPEEIRESLFNPFFTTKPAGEGTGLGLSLSYDIIVKGHKGEIRFETEPGEFTEFIISLPKSKEV